MRPVDKTEQKQPFLGGAQVRKKEETNLQKLH